MPKRRQSQTELQASGPCCKVAQFPSRVWCQIFRGKQPANHLYHYSGGHLRTPETMIIIFEYAGKCMKALKRQRSRTNGYGKLLRLHPRKERRQQQKGC
eukprot:1158401-Pelagomonas_calceolata.AAC.2